MAEITTMMIQGEEEEEATQKVGNNWWRGTAPKCIKRQKPGQWTQIDYSVNIDNRVRLVWPRADISATRSVTSEKEPDREQEEKDMIEVERMLTWTCNRDKATRPLGEEAIPKVVPIEVYVPSEVQLNQLIGHCQAEHEHIMKTSLRPLQTNCTTRTVT